MQLETRILKWTVYVARIYRIKMDRAYSQKKERMSFYNILTGKPTRKIILESPRRRLEDDIRLDFTKQMLI